MNVCVGDIIKLENNQFVAVRGRCPSRPTGLSPPPFFLGGGPNFQIPFTSENPVYSELRLEPKIHLHRNTMYFCRKSNIQ